MEPGIVDLCEISVEDGIIISFLMPQDRCTQLRARSAEETEARPDALLPAEPVDLVCDREHAQPIGILARQRKSQDGKMPRAQQPGVPLDCTLRIHAQYFRWRPVQPGSGLEPGRQFIVRQTADGPRDFGLRGLIEFDQRQAGSRVHQAEQAERIFQRRRVCRARQPCSVSRRRSRWRADDNRA
jgi:hypothetical protein